MALGTVRIGSLEVSRLILGGNPFSGFSHQGLERDEEMVAYYTADRIKATLRQAERCGVTTHIGRTDNHVIRLLKEYRAEGGSIHWIAQTAAESPPHTGAHRAVNNGAKACFIHGGQMDHFFANDMLDTVPQTIAMLKEAGLPAGIAGHNPKVFEWAEEHLDVDFYMCSYYNPTPRDDSPAHPTGATEWFHEEDRNIMVDLIQRLSRPVIHYKVMAAGRTPPREALDFAARHLRPQDAVCIGMHTGDRPDMVQENARLFATSVGQ